MNQDVTHYIENAAEEHQAILAALRKLILSAAPNVTEQFKWGRPVYAKEKDFCYLKTTKKHVTLGFFKFDKITTNKHLIEGNGKSMRHVKLSNTKDVEAFQIKDMLAETLK